ncbi:hypothetical protein AMATHDRAFT_194642 [Amanita thiersii Skay4041]|uniref:Methyltransferase n=1 Tax=Amanita thiersii Skay4041 TaxID=703135 RepID=A0A2A9NPF6_9AGAR|nr:hypothetical protein AMATHDRAFT_194642 [Amanita thiersii Skay4041]
MSSGPTSVTATLGYFTDPPKGERAFWTINVDEKTGQRRKNFDYDQHEVVIENIRGGKEHEVNFEKNGFEFFHRPSGCSSFDDDEVIEREYYPECERIFKEVTGGSRAVLFDHTIRRRRPGQIDNGPKNRQPVTEVHVDQTTASSIARVHRHLPAEDAKELVNKRFQIVNLWRPIEETAIDWPLALCDYRSTEPKKDVFPVALVYPDREGETLGVKYNSKHKWRYLYGMTPDECAVFKCFDSRQDGSVAVFAPHTAFKDPTTPTGTPFRQSIEVRALVFHD